MGTGPQEINYIGDDDPDMPYAEKIGDAMSAEVKGNHRLAIDTLDAMFTEHGVDILPTVITMLVDTTLFCVGAAYIQRPAHAKNGTLTTKFVLDGQPVDAEEVDQDQLWAARMIAARAAWDADTWRSLLLNHIEADRMPAGLAALLDVIGETIRAHRSGTTVFEAVVRRRDVVPDTPEGL